jgi:hypothetical protein
MLSGAFTERLTSLGRPSRISLRSPGYAFSRIDRNVIE